MNEDQPGGGHDDRSATGTREPSVVRIARSRGRTNGDGGNETHAPDVELHERVRGSRPGTNFIRLTRRGEQKLRRIAVDEFEATKAALRPATALGRAWNSVRGVVIGQPLASSQLSHERLSKTKALAIFSSDNLSSSAYATEEILLVLVVAGAVTHALPIAFAIALLAAIVATSYRQLIRAYPGGGGAYVVTRDNLGVGASLLTGSTLFVDYVLTVAVSTAAGVAAITSALPELHDYKVEMALTFVALLTVGNLRGIRESGSLFALPPYFFILTFGSMIVVGVIRVLLDPNLQAAPIDDAHIGGELQVLTVLVVMRAFASGAAALTGIEAIADGVPQFKPPEAKNASSTLVWMATILCIFFVGTTFLATELNVMPSESKTVVAQIGETIFGRNAFFYALQVGTAMILVLAANTAFAGLPTLASVMARDSAVPRQFAFRGDRLAFSNGIIVLGICSAAVLVVFAADTHKIIPLYAFGVFTAFTLSQAGMVIHWKRHREPGWRSALAVNAFGAVVTGIVALVVGGSKFTAGAWMSIALMAFVLVILWRIREHYRSASEQLEDGLGDAQVTREFYQAAAKRVPQTVIVPVDQINRAVLRTVSYARSLSNNVTAVHVSSDHEESERLRARWHETMPDIQLVTVDSPYRSLVEPVLAYVDALDRAQPEQMITVVLPEFITRRPWHRFLHNQLSQRLKNALINRPNTVVVDVPYHLDR